MKIRLLMSTHGFCVTLWLGFFLGISSLVSANTGVHLKAKGVNSTQTDVWQKLAQTHWVPDGNAQAPRVVYLFSDPQCTYCIAFRRVLAQDIALGRIQMRHIMVGLLTEKSHPQAATILGSVNPAKAYQTHRQRLQQGGIAIDPVALAKAGKWVRKNTHLMVPMRTISTPTIFYKNTQGEVTVVYGFPDDNELMQLRR